VTEVKPLLWRIRISALWIFLAVGMSAHVLLFLALPGTLGEVMAGRVGDMELTTGALVFMTLFWIVPLTMAFLALVLPDPVNRYTNAAVGVVATGMWAWDVIEHLVAGEGINALFLATAAMLVAGVAILWHAWKWPTVHDETKVVEEPTPISAGSASTPR
jgi:hypothetical protein